MHRIHSANPFQLPKSLRRNYDKRSVSSVSSASSRSTRNPMLVDYERYHDREPTEDHRLSTLHISKGSFSAVDIDHTNRKASGGANGAGKTLKQHRPKRTGRHSKSMRRIQFVVPSRKRMLRETKQEMKKSLVVEKMGTAKLNQLLQCNKLIKHHSNAPDELKRNIAKSVFL